MRCVSLAAARGLTPREREVMELLARGRSVPYIQEALSVSHNTVRTHVRHIYQKLDVHSQQELISMVMGADTSRDSAPLRGTCQEGRGRTHGRSRPK